MTGTSDKVDILQKVNGQIPSLGEHIVEKLKHWTDSTFMNKNTICLITLVLGNWKKDM